MGRGTNQIATIADCRYLDSTSFPVDTGTIMPGKTTTINYLWYNGGGGNPFQSVFCQGKSLGSIKFGNANTNDGDTTKKYIITCNIDFVYEIIDQEPVASSADVATDANEQAVYIVLTKTNYCPNANSLATNSNVITFIKCSGVTFPDMDSAISINAEGFFELTHSQYYNTTFYIWILAKPNYTWLLYDSNSKAINDWIGYEHIYSGQITWSCVRSGSDDYNEKQCPRASEAKKYFYTTSGLNLNVGESLTSYMHLIKKAQTIRPDIIGWCGNNYDLPAKLTSEQYYGIYGTSDYSSKNLTIDCKVYPMTTGSTSYGSTTTKSFKYNTATTYNGTTLYPTDVKNGYFKLNIDFSFPSIQVKPSTIGQAGGANIKLTRNVIVDVHVTHFGIAGTYDQTYQVIFSQSGTINTSTGIYTFNAVHDSKEFSSIPFYNGNSIQSPKIYICNPKITWSTANSGGGSSATSEIGLWEDE